MPLTVACTLFRGLDVPQHSRGIFTPEWADKLYRGVKRNYSGEFDFVCVTDLDGFEEPIQTVPFFRSARNIQSCILEVFRLPGRVFFTGLDTVIVGSLDDLFKYDGDMAMIRDPNRPHRPASGFMSWENRQDIFTAFNKNPANSMEGGFPGDQNYLARYCTQYLCDFVPGQLVSYKTHVKKNPAVMENARVVYFHGREKPHEVDRGFIKENWV